MSKLEDIKRTIKERFNEAPEQVLLSGAAILVALGKVADLTASAKSKRAYARKMNASLKK